MNDEKISLTIKGMPLVKFQSAERIKSFRKGHLYAKTLSYYRELEEKTGDDNVGDSFEGMIHIKNALVSSPGIGDGVELNDTLLKTGNSGDYVFCMLSIDSSLDTFSFSDEQRAKMLEFGDTALIVLDYDEFINRVSIAAEAAGFECHFEKVRYFDPSIDCGDMWLSACLNGMWSVAFWKRESYAYQQEARFVFTPGNAELDHIILDIGDISDITVVVPSETVLSGTLSKNK